MTRYVAFLRAVNVGGRVVKMEELRRVFANMAFENVATFIASGNVIFESTRRRAAALEQTIEKGLAAGLRFPVTTFVRTLPEVQALVAHPYFVEPQGEGERLFVAFTRESPAANMEARLNELAGRSESFRIAGTHVFWTCGGPLSDSRFSGPLLERTLGMAATVRNATTVRKIVEKFAGGAVAAGQ